MNLFSGAAENPSERGIYPAGPPHRSPRWELSSPLRQPTILRTKVRAPFAPVFRHTPPQSAATNPKGIPPQSPGLLGTSYPGNRILKDAINPNGVAPLEAADATTPLGLITLWAALSQGRRGAPTLGFETESRWD